MLRAVLAVLLIAAVGGLVYFFTHAGARPETAGTVAESAPPLKLPAQTPPKALEPSPEGPAMDSSPQDLAKLNGPEPNLPRATSVAPVDSSVPGAEPGNVKDLPARPLSHAAAPSSLSFDRQLGLPIAGLKQADIHDTFNDARGNGTRRHEAADIMAPRGTPVVAVDSGVVKKLFNSKIGGLTVYQYDALEKYSYYYGHLDRYAEGLKEGMLLKKGDRVGYVGSTGDASAEAPHLHFGILQLGPDKRWWENTTPVNPYSAFVQALKRK